MQHNTLGYKVQSVSQLTKQYAQLEAMQAEINSLMHRMAIDAIFSAMDAAYDDYKHAYDVVYNLPGYELSQYGFNPDVMSEA